MLVNISADRRVHLLRRDLRYQEQFGKSLLGARRYGYVVRRMHRAGRACGVLCSIDTADGT